MAKPTIPLADIRRCAECGREWEAPMDSPFVCPGCGFTSTLFGTHPFPRPSSPLDGITIRYHAAMPNWCKLHGLDIKAVHASEGGGFMIRCDQGEAIIALLRLSGVNEHGE